MYFVISKLDESRLARMEFLVNFGVPLDVIRTMSDVLENGGTFEEVRDTTFKSLPLLQILKLYKYFSWADKKLH
jgi:hypothetical protein